MENGQSYGGGKGKYPNTWNPKGAKGKYTQPQAKGPHTEEGEQDIKKEISKLQQAERTLTELGDSEEGVHTVQQKIKELKLELNGGVEQSRTQKAQSLLQSKNDKDKSRKWLRAHMWELSKELESTNEKWKRKVEELAGISKELAELGWAAMDGDSDYEEENEQQQQLQYQLREHEAAQNGAKGGGKNGDTVMGTEQGGITCENPEEY
jgi:chromosome segregation ATPase